LGQLRWPHLSWIADHQRSPHRLPLFPQGAQPLPVEARGCLRGLPHWEGLVLVLMRSNPSPIDL
jgi:hypothetical protein